MKKVTILIFPLITLLFSFLVFGMVSAKYCARNTISMDDAATLHTSMHISHLSDDGKLNINTATARELTLLPGIGEKLAQSIIEHRESNGPFVCAEEMLEIKGLSYAKLQAIESYICFHE